MIKTIEMNDETIRTKRVHCPVCSKRNLIEIGATHDNESLHNDFLVKCPRCKSKIKVIFE